MSAQTGAALLLALAAIASSNTEGTYIHANYFSSPQVTSLLLKGFVLLLLIYTQFVGIRRRHTLRAKAGVE
uniref:Uncharacterized protein n=1 Tax=Aegilops tauschii subsp. strangulata TaxID=200361 RepID=A0A453GKQ7_AEGTS